jgi:putative DeoR family transcriptional regulator (stage III sporulation protein D)
MKKEITLRVVEEADRIIETKKTIREIAKEFNISKSTVHKDLHDRLYHIDLDRYKKVQEIMQHHIEVRHLRGGESTRRKYKG